MTAPAEAVGRGNRNIAIVKEKLLETGVRAGFSGMTNEKLSDIAKGQALGLVTALGQATIGDIGQDHGIKDGSAGKVVMHAGFGALASKAGNENVLAGAAGGAMGELVPSLMNGEGGNNSPPEHKMKAVTKIATAITMVAAGGDEAAVSHAADMSQEVIENNFMNHTTPEALEKVAKLTDEELEKRHNELENSWWPAFTYDADGAAVWREVQKREKQKATKLASGLSDQQLQNRFKELENKWAIRYSIEDNIVHREYERRFINKEAKPHNHAEIVGAAMEHTPAGKLTGLALEKTTGIDVGASRITEPDLLGTRLAGGKLGGGLKHEKIVVSQSKNLENKKSVNIVDRSKRSDYNSVERVVQTGNGRVKEHKPGRAIRKEDIPRGSKLEYVKPGVVKFDGVEFRAVRDLSHVSEKSLRDSAKTGNSLPDIYNKKLQGHHNKQQYHREKGSFMVEIPENKHKISNKAQHPYGNKKGLKQEERKDGNNLKKRYNKERAKTELKRRGINDY